MAKPSKEKKSVVEKIADVVDHVIHPENHEPASNEAAQNIPSVSMDEEIGKGLTPAHESSSIESDYKNHPKFAKFKSQGVNHNDK